MIYILIWFIKNSFFNWSKCKSSSNISWSWWGKYALYGKNLGLAFQMIDDILDITQDSVTLGKPAMHDFVEGKVTIPYLFLHSRVEDKTKLESLYKKS